MKEFLVAMSPVIAIWVMLLGPVVYAGVRGAVRFLARPLRRGGYDARPAPASGETSGSLS